MGITTAAPSGKLGGSMDARPSGKLVGNLDGKLDEKRSGKLDGNQDGGMPGLLTTMAMKSFFFRDDLAPVFMP